MIQNRSAFLIFFISFSLKASEGLNRLESKDEKDFLAVYQAMSSLIQQPKESLKKEISAGVEPVLVHPQLPRVLSAANLIVHSIAVNKQQQAMSKKNSETTEIQEKNRLRTIVIPMPNSARSQISSRPSSARVRAKEIPHYMIHTQSSQKRDELKKKEREIKEKKDERTTFLFDHRINKREVGGVQTIFQ